MSVKITGRALCTANVFELRCRGCGNKIYKPSRYTRATVAIDGSVFSAPICRVCDDKEDAELITDMRAEAARYAATTADPGDFTKAMAREEA